DLVSHVLTFDYLGALGASLAFPIILVPKLGLVRAALLFGIVNAAVALWTTFLFKEELPNGGAWLRALALIVLVALGGGMVAADWITNAADASLYADEVILARQT